VLDPDSAFGGMGRACLKAAHSTQPAGYAVFLGFLHHPAIVPAQWYRPLIQAALSGWPVDQRLSIAPSYDRPTSLCAHPCLPDLWPSSDSSGVASHAPQEHERLSFQASEPVLEQVRAIVPPDLVITLLADRGARP
jgi:hypothetical protein